MSKVGYASLAPLFDRLLGSGNGTDVDAELDSVGLKESLARELGQLFSTKSRLTLQEYLAGELTVLDYGLPDFTALSPASERDTTLMSEAMTKCLENFEPRLSMVLVAVKQNRGSNKAAHATIMAAVTIGRQALRVDFDLAFTPSEGMSLLPA